MNPSVPTKFPADESAQNSVTVAWVKQLATEAGLMLQETFWQKNKDVETKDSPEDLVTDTDRAVEDFLKKKISSRFPNHMFLCEESSVPNQRLTDAPTWIIDPIDGTNNFVHTLPFTCISIAYAENKQSLIGVVYAPILNEMFWAEKGCGAYLNGQAITTSKATDMSKAIACCGFCIKSIRKQYHDEYDPATKSAAAEVERCVVKNLLYCMHNCRDIRHLGSTALEMCYIAAGRMDVHQAIGPKAWDLAAAMLIVLEAGGCVISFGGQQLQLHEEHVLAGASEQLTRNFIGHFDAPKDADALPAAR